MSGKSESIAQGSRRLLQSRASRVAGLYALAGALWIFFSDRALEWLFAAEGADLGSHQTLKGLGFIAVTAFSLYVLIDQAGRQLRRTKAERDLSEASLSLMVQEAPDYALILLDAEGRVQTWNRGAERIKGYLADEIVGRSVERFYDACDRADGKPARLLRAARENGSATEEGWHLRKDGGRFLANVVMHCVRDDEGACIGYARLVRDVTERRLQQQRLERTQERLQLLLQSVELGLSDSDLAGDRIVFTPGWLAHFGYDEGDCSLSVAEWEARVHPEDLPGIRARIDRAMAEAPVLVDGEYRYRCADGRYRRILGKARALRGEDGRPVRLLASHLDVTDRHETEARLRKAQRLEAVGQLAGGVAHDFNNLLQVISGNLQLLGKDVAGNERAEGRVQNALAGVGRGARLASQLLAFGRRQPLEPKVVNVGRLIAGVAEMLRRTIGEGIEVETVVAGGLWHTFIDPAQLENALLNLAINGRDAMEGQGRLTIEAGNAFLDDAYVLAQGDVQAGQYVMLAVTDTGAGMTPEVQAQAFEPFFSTKPQDKGTGLGLAMVYGFVKQSGGHVKIYSELGHGTTVRLYLPRSLQSEDVPVARSVQAVTGGSETILVVEDDEGVRLTATEMLGDLGYRVLTARDAASALAVIESGLPIDLLFTDVVMPGTLTSAELARTARGRLPDLAVLFTSGYTENAIVHGGRLDPGVDLLAKPYSREALARRVRQALAMASERASSPGPQPDPAPAPAAPAAAGASLSGLRVLLCEDDPLIRLSTVAMLEDLGMRPLEAGSGGEALALLEREGLDLLLVDLGLPDMSGLELVERARLSHPALPVVFATGRREVEGAEGLTRAAVVVKPYSETELAERIAALLAPEG